MIEFREGDIFDAQEKYICHQCNCVSRGAAGLASSIFEKYPYANIYSTRIEPSIPGTIQIAGDGENNRYVINMFAQYYPSIAGSRKDSSEEKKGYFNFCLRAILNIKNVSNLAFPYKISCGLAGGNWDDYLIAIENFAVKLKKEQNARVFIYKK